MGEVKLANVLDFAKHPEFSESELNRLFSLFCKYATPSTKKGSIDMNAMKHLLQDLDLAQTHLEAKKTYEKYSSVNGLRQDEFMKMIKDLTSKNGTISLEAILKFASHAEVDVDDVGVGGAKRFFEAKAKVLEVGDAAYRAFEDRKKTEEEKKVKKEEFKKKMESFQPKTEEPKPVIKSHVPKAKVVIDPKFNADQSNASQINGNVNPVKSNGISSQVNTFKANEDHQNAVSNGTFDQYNDFKENGSQEDISKSNQVQINALGTCSQETCSDINGDQEPMFKNEIFPRVNEHQVEAITHPNESENTQKLYSDDSSEDQGLTQKVYSIETEKNTSKLIETEKDDSETFLIEKTNSMDINAIKKDDLKSNETEKSNSGFIANETNNSESIETKPNNFETEKFDLEVNKTESSKLESAEMENKSELTETCKSELIETDKLEVTQAETRGENLEKGAVTQIEVDEEIDAECTKF